MDADGPGAGTYNVTLLVFDLLNNLNHDTVFITVVDETVSSNNSTDEITYVEDMTGHNITWTPDDLHTSNYEVHQNGTVDC